MTKLVSRMGLHYSWIVAAVAFLVLLTAASYRSIPPVVMIPLENEFGWDRATISSAFSINLLLMGLMSPIAGRMLDAWGSKRLILISLAASAAGSALLVFISSPWHLQILWGVVVGLATGLNGMVLAAVVASRWFIAKRGLVVGVLGGATSAGQLIFLPLLMSTVLQFGWRPAALIAAGAGAALLPLVLWLARDDPADVGLQPYGAASTTAAASSSSQPSTEPNISYWDTFRHPAFWMISGTFFVCGVTTIGLVGTHLVPHWIDVGIPEATAARAVALMGAMNIVGTTLSGWLSDRYDKRRLLSFYYGFRGLSLLFLPFVVGPFDMVLFAIVYGLDWVATVPCTIGLCSEIFGKRSVGVTFGMATLLHAVGSALAAYLTAVVRDSSGDYRMAFFAGGILAIAASMVALRIPKPDVILDDTAVAVAEPTTVG